MVVKVKNKFLFVNIHLSFFTLKKAGEKMIEQPVYTEADKELEEAIKRILDEIDPYKPVIQKIDPLYESTLLDAIKVEFEWIGKSVKQTVFANNKLRSMAMSGAFDKMSDTAAKQQKRSLINLAKVTRDVLEKRVSNIISYILGYMLDHPPELYSGSTDIWETLIEHGYITSSQTPYTFNNPQIEIESKFLKWVASSDDDVKIQAVHVAKNVMEPLIAGINLEIASIRESNTVDLNKVTRDALLKFNLTLMRIFISWAIGLRKHTLEGAKYFGSDKKTRNLKPTWYIFIASQISMVRSSVLTTGVALQGIAETTAFYSNVSSGINIIGFFGEQPYNPVGYIENEIKSIKIAMSNNDEIQVSEDVAVFFEPGAIRFCQRFLANLDVCRKLSISAEAMKKVELPLEQFDEGQTYGKKKSRSRRKSDVIQSDFDDIVLDSVERLGDHFYCKRGKRDIIPEKFKLGQMIAVNVSMLPEDNTYQILKESLGVSNHATFVELLKNVFSVSKLSLAPFPSIRQLQQSVSFPAPRFSTVCKSTVKFETMGQDIFSGEDRNPLDLPWCRYRTVGANNCITLGLDNGEIYGKTFFDTEVFATSDMFSGDLITLTDGITQLREGSRTKKTTGLIMLHKLMAHIGKTCAKNTKTNIGDIDNVDVVSAFSDYRNFDIIGGEWEILFDEPIAIDLGYAKLKGGKRYHLMFSREFQDIIFSMIKNAELLDKHNPFILQNVLSSEKHVQDLGPIIPDYDMINKMLLEERKLLATSDYYKNFSPEERENYQLIFTEYQQMFRIMLTKTPDDVEIRKKKFTAWWNEQMNKSDEKTRSVLKRFNPQDMKPDSAKEEIYAMYRAFWKDEYWNDFIGSNRYLSPLSNLTRKLFATLKIYNLWVEYSLKAYIDAVNEYISRLSQMIHLQAVMNVVTFKFMEWIKSGKKLKLVDFLNTIYKDYNTLHGEINKIDRKKVYYLRLCSSEKDVTNNKLKGDGDEVMEARVKVENQRLIDGAKIKAMIRASQISSSHLWLVYIPIIVTDTKNLLLDPINEMVLTEASSIRQRLSSYVDDEQLRLVGLDVDSMTIMSCMLSLFLEVCNAHNKPETFDVSVYDIDKKLTELSPKKPSTKSVPTKLTVPTAPKKNKPTKRRH